VKSGDIVMPNQQDKTVRNIIIFYVGAMLLSIGGGLIMASGQEAGGLLFILSPLVMVLIVRFLLGDGWEYAGLGLQLKKSWAWYLFALLVYPISFLLIIAINVILGFATLTMTLPEILPLLLTGFVIQFIPRMIYAISEEWAWRGYLEPHFTQLGKPDFQRHLIVGVLWGVWHFPLILSTDYTSVPLLIFLPLFMVGIIFLAIVYGQMQKSSGSVWPAVLMHGLANAIGFAILEGNIIAFNNELFGSIVPGSITTTLVYGLIAFLIWKRRDSKPSPQILHTMPGVQEYEQS
jgi:membrane protease YdiL (CAAX protease family)